MKRILLFSVGLALLLAPQQLAAQEAEEPTSLVYLAFYKVSFADLEEWISGYHTYMVPVLEELRDEGVIQSWTVFQHHTGGEYNWRSAIIVSDWSKFDTFWNEYLARLSERLGDDAGLFGDMIQAHYDEIWDINESHESDGPPAQYMYESLFQVSFSDMEEWNRIWSEKSAPYLDQAMEEGILSGWIVLGHNTGGRYNVKVLYFHDSWDEMDEFFEGHLGSLAEDPEVWKSIGRMIDAHDDVLWAAVPPPTRN